MTLIITAEQEFYSMLSKNVKSINSARKAINKQLNFYLRKNDEVSLAIYTKIYLLIYTSWVEANLTKLLNIPFGFNEDEKHQVYCQSSHLEKWEKCIELAFNKLNKSGSEIPNKKKKITEFVNSYLETPLHIRNKIAHGQWEYPLNRKNDKLEPEIKSLIDSLDIIQVDTWFKIFEQTIRIVGDIIQATKKNNYEAHYKFYFERLENIKKIFEERKSWSIEKKKILLNNKPLLGHYSE